MGAKYAGIWYNVLRKMNVRTRQNRFECGVRLGRDSEGALRCSRDPMQAILCTGGCPSWIVAMGSQVVLAK